MRMSDYEFASKTDKEEWIRSIQMKVGLPYFGGKSMIGKYLFNHIFNMSVVMKRNGEKPDVFIDSFTGGGKMGLSVPKGWYKTIVINDLDYGVYSYYKCCKDNYIALIDMIEKIGSLMSKEFFHLATYMRRFGQKCEKWTIVNESDEKKQTISVPVGADEVVDPLVAGALTYWVTSASFNNITSPESASYNLVRVPRDENGKETGSEDKSYESKKQEQENIKRIILNAKKRIPKLHEQLTKYDYRIENLDYRELIKKYNGMPYKDVLGNKLNAETEWKTKNKLWYFDPPYHPWALYSGKDAPYAETFTVDMANEMVDILAGERVDDYGEIKYFIKSDYDPKRTVEEAERNRDKESVSPNIRKWYKELLDKNKNNNMVTNVFKKLEENGFMKIAVGGFDKGSMMGKKEEGLKAVCGYEYIWTHGFPEGYTEEV